MQTNLAKLEDVKDYPKPKTNKELRAILGLTGYYRRFVKNYGVINRPLIDILKKNSFSWSEEAVTAFVNLKEALCTTHVLALPVFTQVFVVEAGVCKQGIEAVLMQQGKPIAYSSKGFNSIHM